MSQENERNAQIHQAINLLIRTMRMHHRNVEKQFGDTGVHRGQRQMLLHLSKANGTLTQREIAERSDISAACVARTLKFLANEDYITRTGDEDDQRRNNVQITEKGLQVVQETRKAFDEFDQTIFEGIPDEEIGQFLVTLAKLQQNLRAYEEKHADKANLTEGSGSV